MKIGIGELAIVFVVALFIIGPDKLPEAARKFGEILGQFKKASSEATKEIRKSVIDPLEEAQKPIREAMAPVQEITDQMEQNRKSIEKAFRSVGKNDSSGTGQKTGAKEESGQAVLPANTTEEAAEGSAVEAEKDAAEESTDQPAKPADEENRA